MAPPAHRGARGGRGCRGIFWGRTTIIILTIVKRQLGAKRINRRREEKTDISNVAQQFWDDTHTRSGEAITEFLYERMASSSHNMNSA